MVLKTLKVVVTRGRKHSESHDISHSKSREIHKTDSHTNIKAHHDKTTHQHNRTESLVELQRRHEH